MKSLPVGTAYSVWVGVGAVGSVALGIVGLKARCTGLARRYGVCDSDFHIACIRAEAQDQPSPGSSRDH